MLFENLYYLLKPLIPWGIRRELRKIHAAGQRRKHVRTWPIDESAGAMPPRWPGWPEGKKFAVVLTHDVEGPKGLERVEAVMQLEEKQGFRSSFNFVPEGSYRVPDDLREKLEGAGFEVGVHGLKHDGRLYASQRQFSWRAKRIREYADKWKASGFRSPLMQHNLAWIQQLGFDYDASTFDTDPFEPEPDGAGTIFPFWVPNGAGGGYVELPYTLVQDLTLYVILGEKDNSIWKRKLDWVASRGGMVLLNVHPDYVHLGGKMESNEFPASHYSEFLQYIRTTYEGQYWHGLPKDIAGYYKAALPEHLRNTKRRICMVTYSHYENDNRVRRYAEALTRRGDRVEVIAISGGEVVLGTEDVNGVRVHRIQRREHDEQNKWTYVWRLASFLVRSSLLLTKLQQEIRYDLIHVHNMPDFLVFSAWYPKWKGAKVILDIHDVVPELFANKFGTTLDDRYVKALKFVEKKSADFVDHVIVSNHLWQSKLIERTVSADRCSVFINHVDPAVFYRRSRQRTDDKFVIVFPGSFQWHQGLDIAIEAVAHLQNDIPTLELHLYGGGGGADGEARLARLAEERGVQRQIKFCGSVSLDKVPDVVANADLGIVPKRADSFGNEAYSTKIMEFMSQGIPVVVSKTKIDTYYFDDSIVKFFRSGDSKAMAEAILALYADPKRREEMAKRAFEYVEKHSWDTKRTEYFALVDSLCSSKADSSDEAVNSGRADNAVRVS